MTDWRVLVAVGAMVLISADVAEAGRRHRSHTHNQWCGHSYCGDGQVNGNEECDDGNNYSGDGCDAYCNVESYCGDGHVDAGEECDDGNNYSGDGCDAYCLNEPFCGDGHVDPGEQCDDGNNYNGDGCDHYCNVESVCGDGVLDAGEQCDDGNTYDGDGCDSTCNVEQCPSGYDCQPYIQFNNSDPAQLHPYGSQQAVVQFGNTGTATCQDITVVCRYSDVLTAGSINSPFSTVTPGTDGSWETLEFSNGGSGLVLPPGQNYNIGIQLGVDTTSGVVECEILEDECAEDDASLGYTVIGC